VRPLQRRFWAFAQAQGGARQFTPSESGDKSHALQTLARTEDALVPVRISVRLVIILEEGVETAKYAKHANQEED